MQTEPNGIKILFVSEFEVVIYLPGVAKPRGRVGQEWALVPPVPRLVLSLIHI